MKNLVEFDLLTQDSYELTANKCFIPFSRSSHYLIGFGRLFLPKLGKISHQFKCRRASWQTAALVQGQYILTISKLWKKQLPQLPSAFIIYIVLIITLFKSYIGFYSCSVHITLACQQLDFFFCQPLKG